MLRDEANKWEDENNSIIRVVKLMAKQMFEMAEYAKGRGSLRVCFKEDFEARFEA